MRSTPQAVATAETVYGRGLGYEYGRRRGGDGRGFEGIDLRVEVGQVVGVLGPNGAGKSTLLRVLATVLRPTSGELRLLGEDTTRAGAAMRRRIGYAPDEPVHVAPLTGRENAQFFARAAGLSRRVAAQSAGALLERFGLEPDADRPAREYSYGMRRKLLLCEALCGDRALLVLDEPSLGLDPAARDALCRELVARAAVGIPVVLATNDLPLARELCDHVMFLHEGRVVAEGSPAALLAQVGEGAWIDVALAGEQPPHVEFDGLEVVESTPTRLRLRSRSGTAALPALCAALLEQGCGIRGVQVRESDLRDVFNAVTGLGWVPGSVSRAE